MPIMNYTTSIESAKTAGEVLQLLAKKGASTGTLIFEDGEPSGAAFSCMVNSQLVNFNMPLKWRGVLKVMQRDSKIPRSAKNERQARRVAWRILKDWVMAQIAMIESGNAEFAEVFLPYAVNEEGKTLFQVMQEQPRALLGNAEPKLLRQSNS